MKKDELIFEVSSEDGMLVAVSTDPDLATQAETMEDLVKMVRELVECHFDEGDELRSAKTVFHFRDEKVRAYA